MAQPALTTAGWYLRHNDNPTAVDKGRAESRYYSTRDIKAGEEITVDHRAIGDERFGADTSTEEILTVTQPKIGQ